jgi:hypothetical protein
MFGTRRALLSGNALDPDALAYFAMAGVSDGAVTHTSYDNAASFNGTTQYLSVTSNSNLTVTGSSFSYSFWLNQSALGTYCVIGKTAITDTKEFQIFCNSGSIAFAVFPDGTNANKKEVTSAAIPANTWAFVTCVYNSGNGTISVYVNAGTPVTVGSVLSITQTNTNSLQFGVYVSSLYYFSGKINAVGFWKRALDSTEITSLYNNGIGLTYSGIVSAGLTSNIKGYWALNQASVTADSAGSNTLTNNGTVTASVLGPIVTATASSRQLINSFVKQIKGFGLWSSIVCWPMRSSQNKGNGTTLYSLGGLGNYNGTLAGSVAPQWTSKGILNSGGGGMITTSLAVGFNQQISGVVAAQSTSTSGFGYLTGNNSSSENLYWLNPRTGFGSEFRYCGSNYGGSDTTDVTMSMWSVLCSALNKTTVYKNSTLLGTAAANATTPTSLALTSNLTLGRSNGAFQGTQAFAFVINSRLSDANYTNYYSIYKSTLGLGLQLP